MTNILLGIGCFILFSLVISVLVTGCAVCGFMATKGFLDDMAEMEVQNDK